MDDEMTIYDPKDLVFAIYEGEDMQGIVVVFVTPREVWDNEKRFLDGEFEWPSMDQDGFYYLSDSNYEFEGTEEQAKHLLKTIGMEERPEMATDPSMG